jgi:hypothetical protein
MTTDGAAYIIRSINTLHPDDMKGHDLEFDSCFTSVRNVCGALLRLESEDLAAEQEHLHAAMNHWADKWGKEVSNSVTKLVMIEGRRGESHVRHFALLVRAGYNPKYQLWAIAEALQVPGASRATGHVAKHWLRQHLHSNLTKVTHPIL